MTSGEIPPRSPTQRGFLFMIENHETHNTSKDINTLTSTSLLLKQMMNQPVLKWQL